MDQVYTSGFGRMDQVYTSVTGRMCTVYTSETGRMCTVSARLIGDSPRVEGVLSVFGCLREVDGCAPFLPFLPVYAGLGGRMVPLDHPFHCWIPSIPVKS